ncbi:four-carbon acid sugar kinase family protein [Bradyrhizobium manausense]|uniref:four-carbon acid sugar kinase family protein n=1 Tax=Bradyrhizobium TaxID=374 RepID=UPI001BA6AB93|nr:MULTISPECIES: four-carbon acid sugar kinase family protein [Bradyrhizobium]MBR0829941.1 four-carbon acid sugar kinase family protein [Bradyrhizobium manausense]UVO27683.1 four-carbon acid sugar kinase family protein [Bradyrhizobium arachidis]
MSGTTFLPDGPLVAFYGDDYTGSSAAMEALTFAGLPTILFLEPPTPERLAASGQFRGIGIAGTARAKDPAWMEQNLPAVFDVLAGIGAPIAHYKVCSTFDSAPHIGSIGRAIDLAVPRLGGSWHPLLVGSPAMGRYQMFGNLFAAVNGVGHRLDRHPTMSRHPVTPMDESDLGRHLAKQTARSIGLIDFVTMARGGADEALARAKTAGTEIISLDVLDQASLIEAGRLIWQHRGERLFAAGSQGVEQALVAYWRAAGLIPDRKPDLRLTGVERIACVSGSCSPVTAGQITHAAENGFDIVRLDAARAVDAVEWTKEIGRAAERGLAALSSGRDALLITASGPDDPAIGTLNAAIKASGANAAAVNDRIGAGLGQALDSILETARLQRAVVAGGDTSGHALQAMGIYALTAIAPLAEGAPLCRASSDRAHARTEIALKGGQVGGADLFRRARDGG